MQTGELFHERYRLLEEKGRGAFGEVWLAHDEQTDLDVAVKMYIALDDHGIEEFKSEYKNAYALNHPNLLHASHFDISENRPFLIMPYCPSSAEKLIGTTDENLIWKFIHDVASGLAYLHEKNILHRDIKPDNILSDKDGSFLITDFGVSTKMKSTLRRNSTRAMSHEDTVSGTIGYMAPELFSRTPDAVKATDIWAFGATIFEIINGELPFYGQGGIMLEHGAEIPELKGNWSDNLKTVVESCLAKDPWSRPTAKQLAEFASDCLNGNGKKPQWKHTPANISENKKPKGKNGKKTIIAVLSSLFSVVAVALLIASLCIWGVPGKKTATPTKVSMKPQVQATTPRPEQKTAPTGITKTDAPNNKVQTNNPLKSDAKPQNQDERPAKLKMALQNGDYTTVKQMADRGYAPAYIPLARHYMNTPSTHGLADQYAQKAKSAGIVDAQRIIDDLDSLGYYD